MTDDKIALRALLEKGSDATFLREMISFAAQRLMELESEAQCGAGYGERRVDRRKQRRLPRARLGDSHGDGRAAYPKLRRSSYFPVFLEPRRLAEKALTAVVQEAGACLWRRRGSRASRPARWMTWSRRWYGGDQQEPGLAPVRRD
jgi:transposase-like protein